MSQHQHQLQTSSTDIVRGLGKAEQLHFGVNAQRNWIFGRRREFLQQLSEVKEAEVLQIAFLSWDTFSGFFDAEGHVCITVKGQCQRIVEITASICHQSRP